MSEEAHSASLIWPISSMSEEAQAILALSLLAAGFAVNMGLFYYRCVILGQPAL